MSLDPCSIVVQVVHVCCTSCIHQPLQSIKSYTFGGSYVTRLLVGGCGLLFTRSHGCIAPFKDISLLFSTWTRLDSYIRGAVPYKDRSIREWQLGNDSWSFGVDARPMLVISSLILLLTSMRQVWETDLMLLIATCLWYWGFPFIECQHGVHQVYLSDELAHSSHAPGVDNNWVDMLHIWPKALLAGWLPNPCNKSYNRHVSRQLVVNEFPSLWFTIGRKRRSKIRPSTELASLNKRRNDATVGRRKWHCFWL